MDQNPEDRNQPPNLKDEYRRLILATESNKFNPGIAVDKVKDQLSCKRANNPDEELYRQLILMLLAKEQSKIDLSDSQVQDAADDFKNLFPSDTPSLGIIDIVYYLKEFSILSVTARLEEDSNDKQANLTYLANILTTTIELIQKEYPYKEVGLKHKLEMIFEIHLKYMIYNYYDAVFSGNEFQDLCWELFGYENKQEWENIIDKKEEIRYNLDAAIKNINYSGNLYLINSLDITTINGDSSIWEDKKA